MAGMVTAAGYRATGLYDALRQHQEAAVVRPDQRRYDWTADLAGYEASRRAVDADARNQPKHSALLDKLRAGEPVVITWSAVRPLVPVEVARRITDGRVAVRVHSDDRVELAGNSPPDSGVW
jgi:hypothetical protein